jgi:hypothetical protein
MSNRGQYGTWEEVIEMVLGALRSGSMGLNYVALTYDVLKATLKGELMGPTNAVGRKRLFERTADLPSEVTSQFYPRTSYEGPEGVEVLLYFKLCTG